MIRSEVYPVPTRIRARIVKRVASACLAAASALSVPGLAHSQVPYPDLPPHAHYSNTEQGWTCNDGYKQAAGYCMADGVDMPSQGPFEVFDGQWRCRSGYKRSGNFCVTPTAPAHATLAGGGGGWECDWGFRKAGSRCEEINPPAHAYLDASGHDWVCYPGYERRSDECIAAAPGVPDTSGGAKTGSGETSSSTSSRDASPH